MTVLIKLFDDLTLQWAVLTVAMQTDIFWFNLFQTDYIYFNQLGYCIMCCNLRFSIWYSSRFVARQNWFKLVKLIQSVIASYFAI